MSLERFYDLAVNSKIITIPSLNTVMHYIVIEWLLK